MIRKGKKYIVESREEFIDRTKFSKMDALEANGVNIIEIAQESLPDTEPIPDDINDVPKSVIHECFAELDEVIQPTLQADTGEWVHLYDGIIHTIINLHPEEKPIWAEGKVTPEGISASLYQENGDQPALLDEYWVTWSELIDGDESWASFQDVDIDTERFELQGTGQ